jgi:chemotaxis protein methyltransferase WspC
VDRSEQDPGAVDERQNLQGRIRIMTPLEDFDRLLKQTMGLDIASIGASALERAVRERQRECSVDDTRSYLDRVRASKDELQALIETIVVPETWFFRDRAAFAALVRFVREEWLPTHADGCLRLLSLPCSTGEEPYSMAMALLDAHVPPSRFRIDAIDICGRSLAHARRGIYGKGSFRGDATAAYRERYFEPVTGGHALFEAVRRQVNFQQGNLFNAGFLPGADIYDVVFCRNLLIYFDRATQDQAVSVLDRLLTLKGILFAGSSESGVFANHSFSSAKMPMAFAFRKGRSVVTPKPQAAVTKMRHLSVRRPITSLGPSLPPTEIPLPLPRESGAEEAIQLADQGHFAEASRCCEAQLLRQGPSAQVFHVLGLVRDASGNADDAAIYYRKALYLDPGHQDALVHLALLMEKQGLKSEAQTLWNRARRLATPRAQ